jgi:hypothetical protein
VDSGFSHNSPSRVVPPREGRGPSVD